MSELDNKLVKMFGARVGAGMEAEIMNQRQEWKIDPSCPSIIKK